MQYFDAERGAPGFIINEQHDAARRRRDTVTTAELVAGMHRSPV